MKITIIGNGPSYRLFRPQDKGDLLVGCNIPPDVGASFDFTVIADEKALIQAVRTHKVQEHTKIVLGPRAAASNDVCKYKPGGKLGLVKGLERAKRVKGYVVEPEGYGDVFRRNGYFSSGHMAFKYVMETYNPTSIELYGFDSIFTGKQSTYSDFTMGGTDSIEKALNPTNKKHDCPDVWYESWMYAFDKIDISDVNIRFYAFEGQSPKRWDMFKDNVNFVPVLGERND